MLKVLSKKGVSPIAQLIKAEPELVSILKTGSIVEAKLLEKSAKKIYFDLGRFGTGVVFGQELINAKNILKNLALWEIIPVKVLDLDGEDGLVELSVSGAYQQKNWQELKALQEAGEVLTVKIAAANSGGLIAEINNIKAFLPVSQLTVEHYPRVLDASKSKILEELKKFIGQELKVKIIDLNPRNGKLIISEREAEYQNTQELISKYKVGDIIEGIVSGIADFGAFIRFADNPAIEGLIHISELDHRLIDNPKEIVSINEAIKAKILDIKGGQIYLSLKALKTNPWERVLEIFQEGQDVLGALYKFNPLGAYIKLNDDFYGLIHVSEFGGTEEMRKRLEPEKKYEFVIHSIKPEEKRIFLKLK